MCGILGILSQSPVEDMVGIVGRMTDALTHRGPDDQGVWCDQEYGIALGHRRLAVIDLSPAGHQPMESFTGRYVIVFNGEVYNHEALRAELVEDSKNYIDWNGHSDTETLLAYLECWGLEQTLHKIVGMFALGVWDRQERVLYLARDRMGEKPLYYGWCDNDFIFTSELKTLGHYQRFAGKISRKSLNLFFRYSYIPAPFCIYDNFFKLEAGYYAVIPLRDLKKSSTGALRECSEKNGLGYVKYWSLHNKLLIGQSNLLHDEDEGIALVESKLRSAIGLQSIADVPLGAFLSGGIDSSLVVSLMQTQQDKPVQTFTIGFDQPGYNEAEYAKTVAAHLGTDHTELYLSPQQTRDVIPLLPELYDEPFADSSQIPTYLISKLARDQVTVALSGDGGDELFGGYNRYNQGIKIWNKVRLLPLSVRQILIKGLLSLSGAIGGDQHGIGSVLQKSDRTALLRDKLQKLGLKLESVRDIDEFYLSLVSEWRHPEELLAAGSEPETLLTQEIGKSTIHDPIQRMMYLDAMTYLPDDILCKIDRAAMGVSLETRVPMLDHRVVELSCRLPLQMKIRNNCSKWVLRQILYKYVPKDLIERPKKGFAVPLASWLRGPLREWAEDMLDPAMIGRQGFLNPGPVRKKWGEHLSGKMNWGHSIWSVLMFQSWLEHQERM
jgi:asparagine synthase (glutamine-hydrolysing)